MSCRKKVVKVLVDSEQKERIARTAKQCGLSMSAYLGRLGDGYQPMRRTDLSGLAEAMKVAADLRRLGGLLKMLLTNDERLQDMGRDMAVTTIDNALLDIRVNLDLLKQILAAYVETKQPD